MVTVEAEVTDTMNKILPRNQELIPVCLKRKMEYKGNVMEEIVSKSKVKMYYDFLKENTQGFSLKPSDTCWKP